ncbi:MAG: amidohydrolase family protein [Alphaproteobacteria bacterium]|nr:amidohydrolase family protein [Alphaproteobacteria bacterium]
MSVLSAFKAQTITAAWQVFQEGERGSIVPGKLADFAILTHNPVAQPEMLNQTRVAQTIRRGSCVYRAN